MVVNYFLLKIGELSTHKGSGSGSVNVSLRRITSPDGWAELELGFGNGLSFSAKGFRNLTKRMFTNISGILTSTDEGLSFGFVSSMLCLPFSKFFCNFCNVWCWYLSTGTSTRQEYGRLPNLQKFTV